MLYTSIILLLLFVIAFIKASDKNLRLHGFNLRETLPLRGMLAVCVMLCHLCPYLDDKAPLLNDFGLWGPPSVATFFLLTGYGLSFSYLRKGANYLDGFFMKRIMRLLWPLVIMTIIFQGWKVYNGFFDFIQMLLEPSPMSWFIYALVIWYVIYYVSFKNLRFQLQSIWIFTAVYIALMACLNVDLYYISILPLPMAITYVQYEDRVRAYIDEHRYFILSATFIITMTVMTYAVLGQSGMKLPLWGPPVYTVVPWTIVLLTYFLGGWKCKFWNFLGSISYEFYIVHGFIVMNIGPLEDFGLGQIGCYLNIIIVLALSTTCGWIMKSVCEKIRVYTE